MEPGSHCGWRASTYTTILTMLTKLTNKGVSFKRDCGALSYMVSGGATLLVETWQSEKQEEIC